MIERKFVIRATVPDQIIKRPVTKEELEFFFSSGGRITRFFAVKPDEIFISTTSNRHRHR